MKKFIIPVFLCLISFFMVGADFSTGVQKDDYYDFLESVNLSPAQRKQVLSIRKEEMQVLEPFMLEVQSKNRGLEFLYTLKCDWRDSVCKQKLKDDIAQKELEKREANRKILQKKNYYKIRYRNVLTREQDVQIRKLIEETEHRDKVLAERAERAEKQARIDKLKVWRKLPDVKNKLTRKKTKAGKKKGG